MSEKECTKCNELKLISHFNKQSDGKNGIRSYCRKCQHLLSDLYLHSKEGLLTAIYTNQRWSSSKKGYEQPSYSKQVLGEWLNNQPNFDMLYLNWINSGYSKWKRPSCDRLDDYKPYTLDNLRLVTWKENFEKYCIDRKNGINKKTFRPVVQLDKSGKFISSHESISLASRNTHTNITGISLCCSGDRNHAGGYKWRYKR